jgi:hypothetical protein
MHHNHPGPSTRARQHTYRIDTAADRTPRLRLQPRTDHPAQHASEARALTASYRPYQADTCAAPRQGPITQRQEKTDNCDGPVRVCVDGLRYQAARRVLKPNYSSTAPAGRLELHGSPRTRQRAMTGEVPGIISLRLTNPPRFPLAQLNRPPQRRHDLSRIPVHNHPPRPTCYVTFLTVAPDLVSLQPFHDAGPSEHAGVPLAGLYHAGHAQSGQSAAIKKAADIASRPAHRMA